MRRKRRAWRGLPAVGLLALAGWAPAPAGAEAAVFQFERLNRSYAGVVDEMVPMEEGGLLVKLRAPQHRLTIRRHEIELRRAEEGRLHAALELEFEGSAHLIAALEVVGASTELEDDITIPLQTRLVAGEIEMERTAEGYLIRLVDLPPAVPVEIESELGARLVSWCSGILGLLGFDCQPLGGLFRQARVPLPENGSVFVLDPAELTPAEQQRLDAYLSR